MYEGCMEVEKKNVQNCQNRMASYESAEISIFFSLVASN